MIAKLLLVSALVCISVADDCLHCICLQESGCSAIGCNWDVGSLSCGYYQIKLPYYQDCGEPNRQPGQDLEEAWKACSDDYDCATQCVLAYNARYAGNCDGTGEGTCEVMARNHNGGPYGCTGDGTLGYWNSVQNCCGCT